MHYLLSSQQQKDTGREYLVNEYIVEHLSAKETDISLQKTELNIELITFQMSGNMSPLCCIASISAPCVNKKLNGENKSYQLISLCQRLQCSLDIFLATKKRAAADVITDHKVTEQQTHETDANQCQERRGGKRIVTSSNTFHWELSLNLN